MNSRSFKRNIFASVFALLTVVSMAVFFSRYEAWMPIGPELIPDGSFSTPSATNAWSGWSGFSKLVPDGGYKGSPGVVLTTSSNQNGVLRFTVHSLTNIPAFRVSMRAAAHGIVRGKESYHVPRAIFFYHDTKEKSLYGFHHGVMDIDKDTGWRHYKDFFPVPKDVTDAHLHIQNFGTAGVMQIDDVSVIPVRERTSAPWWRIFFGALWTAAFGVCLFALRPWERRHGWMIMAVLTMIMTGIALPGEMLDGAIKNSLHTAKSAFAKPETTKRLTVQSPEKTAPVSVKHSKPSSAPKADPVIALPGTAVDQAHIIGHLTLFSLLAFLCALSWMPDNPSFRRAVTVSAGLAFFASATEVLQYIPANRSAGLSDLRVDLIGMTAAVAAVLVLRRIQHRISRD
jgi:hypothetical protein